MRTAIVPMGNWLPIPLALTFALAVPGCGSDKPTGPAPAPPASRLTSPHIAFSSNRSGSIGIHLYDLTAGSIVRLSPAGAYEQEPVISPDGSRIAFSPYRSEGRFHLMTMAVDGTDRIVCSDEASASDTGPHWSPDSRRLVFTRTDRATAARDVYTVLANGDSLQRVTWNGHSTALDWSPDGARLLFAQDSTSFGFTLSDVATCDVDGAHYASLFGQLAWTVIGADYSSDGRYIAFTYEGLSASPRLAVSNANGSGRTPIGGETDFATVGGIGRPSWSPDGTSIVFSAHRDGGTDDLYTVFVADGSEPTPLFTGSPWDFAADWGPKP
ncbi:MAG TPA: hypothetical protein VFS09_02445 [Candidatus Eisenbacteria bacterium]|nr:hypothetical protein [Candidatus Eisenbacteria bacterium]